MTRHWSDIWWRVSLCAMFQTFNNQTDIPDDLKPHYSKREDGKWHADIPDDHPAVKNNAKLLSDKSAADAQVTKLTSDLESARAGNLGRGQIAISTADAKLLDQYKALGTPDEVGAIKTEHATLKEKDAERTRNDLLRKVAKAHNYNEDAFVLLRDLPDFISRPSKDGKSTDWFAQIKDDKGVITEKPAKEFVESAEHIKPFMSSLTQKSDGVRVPTTGPTVQPVEGDQFAWARDFGKRWNEEHKPSGWATNFGTGQQGQQA